MGCLTSIPGVAHAQEGPITFGQKSQTQWLSLNHIEAAAEVKYEYISNRQAAQNTPTQKLTDSRWEETLTLSTTGSIYHPNLVWLDLTGKFGLSQETVESADIGTDHRNGTILDYDLEATFLRKEEAPVTIYARRNDDIVSRTFGPTLESTLETYGAYVDWHNKTIPTRVEVFHSEETQTGFAESGGDFSLVQDSLVWHSEYHPSLRQFWTWDYTLSDVDESTEGFAADNFWVSDAALTNSIDFGQDNRHNLSSSLTHLYQTGDFGIQRFRWDERLLLRHTPNFETNYKYSYDHFTFQDQEQSTHRAQIGMTHRLYKSLITDADVGLQHITRGDESTSFEQYAHVRTNYLKQVPLGSFDSFLSLGWDRVDNSEQDRNQVVVDELKQFSNDDTLLLNMQLIDPASIHVTNIGGTRTYVQGVDYNVNTLGNRIELERAIGTTRIAPNEAVLVDYELGAIGANITTTNTFGIGGRYNIERSLLTGLSPYARFTRQEQTIDGDSGLLIPNSFTDVLIGSEYRFWRVTVGAEQQWHDSTLYPFDATRMFVRYTDRLWHEATVNAGVNYSLIKYPDIDNEVRLLSASTTITQQVTHDLFVLGSILYRNEEDDLNGSTRGLEEQAEIQWRRRQTTISFIFRNSDFESDTHESNFQYFSLRFRRDF